MTDSLSPSVHYPWSDVPGPGEAREVASGVFWLRMPLPFALNHINLWLLADGDGWTIIDSGYGVDETKILWETVFSGVLARRPIGRLIVTHFHPDHVGCANWLAERWGCEVWMTETEFLAAHAARDGTAGNRTDRMLDHFRRQGLGAAGLSSLAARGNRYRRGVPALPHQFRRIVEGDEIVINDKAWRVIVGRGHAPEHAMLHSVDLGVLISGDQVLPRITTNVGVWPNQPNGNPLQLFLDSMPKLDALAGDTLVLPSHDRVFYGLHERLAQLRAHHSARLADIEAACVKPQSAASLLPLLFKRDLDAHQLAFALGEATAHLHLLMYAGRLQRSTGADGVYRFSRNSG